ncbi:hypothetical protein CA85_35740 [Allorhodopirellula solitaria]|uniref:Uncharacterized protein n=1 Tax=Allorhodopirellula solitaria TaxID=2527987 RepID=A0A5C5XQB8_9BACT|nr:hypothetical protein CA85_35740 [Allorhodopirellula solitaria]
MLAICDNYMITILRRLSILLRTKSLHNSDAVTSIAAFRYTTTDRTARSLSVFPLPAFDH